MPDCNACKSARKGVEPVPFIVHEAEMARKESTIKKWWIMCIILAALLFASLAGNAYLWWYESQFEVVSSTTEIDAEQNTDGGGSKVLVGGDYYGVAESAY